MAAPYTPRYSPTKAAIGFSTATGVGAGFSLAAVVLVFTISATAPKAPRYFLGFAAAMFTVSTVGLLICSFSYSTLSSTEESAAGFLHELLNSSGLTICFLAELAGFAALARPYLPAMTSFFVLIICASVILSPLWIWLVQSGVVDTYGPREGLTRESYERRIRFFAIGAALLAVGAVVVALNIRGGGVRVTTGGSPYRSLTLSMLTYVGATVFTGTWLSSRTNGDKRANLWMLAIVAALKTGLMGWLIAALP